MKRKKPAKPRVRRTLTLAEANKHYATLDAAIYEHAARWGSHGWALVGKKNSLRVEIAVPKTLASPRAPIEPIVIPALETALKPSVQASLDGLSVATISFTDDVFSTLTMSVIEPLAPGSRVFIDSNPTQRAGLACFVQADGDVYAITCGHVFEPGATSTGVFTLGHKVATLSHNFLDDADQLDAAYCKLTPKGQHLLAKSAAAPTWFDGVLTPEDGQGLDAVFWPSNDGAGDAITTNINSFSASESHLFNDFWDLTLSRLIRTEQVTVPGDSGSLLAVDDQYYGSCTGSPSWSYFTPLHATLARMQKRFTKVELWLPTN